MKVDLPSHPEDYDILSQSLLDAPTISVIVAIYNMENNGFLAECLKSFDEQTCSSSRIEYVLADDCSTDASLSVALEWAKNRDNVTVIHLHKNMRQGAARNRAIWESRGKWFAVVDADDFVSADYFATILAAADETDADAIVQGGFMEVDVMGEPLGPELRCLKDQTLFGIIDEEKRRRLILDHWPFGVWPRKLFEDKNNWFLEGIFFEDTPVAMRWILQLRSVADAGGGCYFYRINPHSTLHTTAGDIQKLEDRLFSSNAILELAKSLGEYDRFKDELDWYYLLIGFFNTLALASKGVVPREFVIRVSDAAHNRVDMFSNAYYKNQPLPKRLFSRFRWNYPWPYYKLRRMMLVLLHRQTRAPMKKAS